VRQRALSTWLLALVLIVAAAGCGGGEEAAPVACDDASFLEQDEELYVAQATVANAAAAAAPPGALATDLRRGADALASIVDEASPCSEDLLELLETERSAVASMRDAADAVESGRSPTALLEQIATDLAAVEAALARKG
jgi:hypothetical protein